MAELGTSRAFFERIKIQPYSSGLWEEIILVRFYDTFLRFHRRRRWQPIIPFSHPMQTSERN